MQLATALDASYGHWNDNKLKKRQERLQTQKPPNPTSTGGYSNPLVLTLQVTGNDDQIASVPFDIDQWRTRGLQVTVDEQSNRPELSHCAGARNGLGTSEGATDARHRHHATLSSSRVRNCV